MKPRTGAAGVAVAALAACVMLSSCSISARFGRGVDTPPGQNPGEGVQLSTQGAITLFTGAALVDWISAVLLGDKRGGVPPPPADMAEDRAVHEQDCNQPIEKPQANLRCR